MFLGKKYPAIISLQELRLARGVIMRAHNKAAIEAEVYLEEIVACGLQLWDSREKGFRTTEDAARTIRQLAGNHGHTILKAIEAKLNLP